MDVDDDIPSQGNQPRAAPTFPVPRDTYGVSPDIGTGSTRPRMPYPPAKAAPPTPASYAAAAAVPAPNTGNFPMAEWPFEHKYYKLVSKMAKEPGNWEAIKWMKRASTWAHTETKPRNKLQSLILYTWKMPTWATGLIDAGDPSVPPGIKDSRRRAKSRRSEVPPPATAAGVEASASNPNVVPGSTPVTIGGNTVNRIPPQGWGIHARWPKPQRDVLSCDARPFGRIVVLGDPHPQVMEVYKPRLGILVFRSD